MSRIFHIFKYLTDGNVGSHLLLICNCVIKVNVANCECVQLANGRSEQWYYTALFYRYFYQLNRNLTSVRAAAAAA